MIEAVRRQQAATLTVARFRGAALVYGKNDCVRLGAFVLRKMGHKVKLAQAGSYKSMRGARRALDRAGYATIADALDAMGLQRIPPAAALPADLVLIPGEGPFGGSLTMALGNGRVLGYHEDVVGADVLQPTEFVAAWRV
ncbi:DUF6950 family protein [Sphingomonas panni]